MALPSIDPQQRKKILLLTALVLGGLYLAYDYVYSPRAEAVAVLEERHEKLEAQNRTARALTGGGGSEEIERRLASYRDQLKAVEGLIPSSEELPDLLDAISAEAQRTGVQITLIQPVGATEESYYTRRVYDVAVRGSYHSVGEFLTRIASLPRIVTPTGLTLTAVSPDGSTGSEPPLEARFSIETYVISYAQEGSNAAQAG